jgi:hypothetical protein
MTNRLRVLFVTEDDPLYVIRFFEVFFREYPTEAMEISGITIDRAFHEPAWKTVRRMLRFYGFVGVARLSTRFLRARLSGRSIARLARDKAATFRSALSPLAEAPRKKLALRQGAPLRP